jgi:hypothetical protein
MPRMEPPTISIPGGFQVPLSKWATAWLSAIAIVAIGFGAYRYFYPVEPELISVKQANHLLRLEIDEYNRHIVEAPAISLTDDAGNVSLRLFDDGCLVVWQKRGTRSSTRLLVDPSRANAEHRSGDVSGALHHEYRRLAQLLEPAAQAAGRCLNPHPGQFTWQYGKRIDNCWVEVWRQFADGCVHMQLFNACGGSWDSNPDGSARVQWTRCLH